MKFLPGLEARSRLVSLYIYIYISSSLASKFNNQRSDIVYIVA